MRRWRDFTEATAAAIFIGVIGWYGFFEPCSLSYQGEPQTKLEKHVYAPGETLVSLTSRCNSSDHPVTYLSSRRFQRVDVKAEPIDVESTSTTVYPGCHPNQVGRRLTAPPDPGVYFFYGESVVPGTWLTHYLPWRSEQFEVRRSDPVETK